MPESEVIRMTPGWVEGSHSAPRVSAADRQVQLRLRSSSKAGIPPDSSAADVVVLCWNVPGESGRRAREIAAFMGATVALVPVTAANLDNTASTQTIVPKCSCLIVEAETLASIADRMSSGVNGLLGMLQSAEHVFIHGFQTNARHDAVLQTLSSKKLVGTRSLPGADAKFHVASGHPEWCFQFSGLTVGRADAAREKCFVEGDPKDASAALIRIGDQPYLVREENERSQLFFLAGGEFADLDQKVTRHCSSLKWFSGLVPLMLFLRGTLKDRVWHNDHPRACFIIDDPLLKSRHGFLEYKKLFESLHRQRFSVCIAFIPWNYRRSKKKIAKLFSSNRDSAFLCVHGCDHTGAEFASTDVDLLRGKAKLALERMNKHRDLSGVPCDEVMVFPQGLFSGEALSALRAAGYVAAVNTELSPPTMPDILSLRDLLDVAVTRFSNFPLFGRRYPNNLAEFAFDLFLGKPALAVEHHGYFRDGYHALEAFVVGLNALDARIEWTSLEAICSRACLCKNLTNGDLQVRFYTDHFQLENDTGQRQVYELLHSLPSDDSMPSVTVGGRHQDYECDEHSLKMRISLTAGQTADVRVALSGADNVDSAVSNAGVHSAWVTVRRLLCEFRDNHLHTNPVLRRFLSSVK